MGGPTGPLVALTDISLMMQIDPVTLGKSSYIDYPTNVIMMVMITVTFTEIFVLGLRSQNEFSISNNHFLCHINNCQSHKQLSSLFLMTFTYNDIRPQLLKLSSETTQLLITMIIGITINTSMIHS